MKLTAGGGGGIRYELGRHQSTVHYTADIQRLTNCIKCLLVSDGLDGLSSALVVVFLHVPVHGAQLHLPSEVDIHRTLLHCGVDELI